MYRPVYPRISFSGINSFFRFEKFWSTEFFKNCPNLVLEKKFNKIEIAGHRRCFRIKLVQIQNSSHFEKSLLP